MYCYNLDSTIYLGNWPELIESNNKNAITKIEGVGNFTGEIITWEKTTED